MASEEQLVDLNVNLVDQEDETKHTGVVGSSYYLDALASHM